MELRKSKKMKNNKQIIHAFMDMDRMNQFNQPTSCDLTTRVHGVDIYVILTYFLAKWQSCLFNLLKNLRDRLRFHLYNIK